MIKSEMAHYDYGLHGDDTERFWLDGEPIDEDHLALAERLIRTLRNNNSVTVEEFMSEQTVTYQVRQTFDKMALTAARDPRGYIRENLKADLHNMVETVYREALK